ncbi:MAG TPA: glycosyltransferase family 87 protein [bacterium]|nr:glycosyltransferase family 87 protein [bacterium]HOL47199.1 glycosyltransferase family 87 protein [bacterium]HPQ17692.1 glycosyltransferase family 87 protein [bacterium]
MINKKFLNTILLCATIINFFYNAIYRPLSVKNGFYDFRVLLAAGKEARKNNPDFYQPVIYRKTDFNYLPIVSLLFLPFTFFPDNIAVLIWFFFNLCLLVLLFFIICKINNLVFKNKFFFITSILLLNFNPLFETIKWGQLNILLLLLILFSLYFFLLKKDLLSGFFLGISIILKILPIIFFIYFIIHKKFKILFSATITIFFFIFLSLAFFGYNINYDYFFKKLPETAKYGHRGNFYNQSFQSLCFRLFWKDNGYTIAWFDNFKFAVFLSNFIRVLLFLLLIFFLFSQKYSHSLSFCLFSFLITLSSINLIHSLSWEHHYLFSIYLFIFIFIFFKIHSYRSYLFFILLFLYLIIALKFPYDNKIFAQGFLILLSGIKLYALTIFWCLCLIIGFARLKFL